MKKQKKGTNGYIESRFRHLLIKTLIGFGIVAALFVIGLIAEDGNRNNFFTLAAILVVLPTAKIAVSLYMFGSHKKLSPKEEYEQLKALIDEKILASDMILTIGEKVYGIDFAVVTDTGICCFCHNQGLDVTSFCTGAQNFIRSCGYEVTVTVLKDFKKFKDRVKSLKKASFDMEKAQDVRHAFLIMSL